MSRDRQEWPGRDSVRPRLPIPWWYGILSFFVVAVTMSILGVEETMAGGLFRTHPIMLGVIGVLTFGGLVIVSINGGGERD